jgi:hypothetical protein
MIAKFVYNTLTRHTFSVGGNQPSDLYVSELTEQGPYEIFRFRTEYPKVDISTRFIGHDARELYPHTCLKDVQVPLLFETEVDGYKSFWHDYEQARLGNRLTIEANYHEKVTQAFIKAHEQLETALDKAGMPDYETWMSLFRFKISDLSNQPRIYTPITMPASGYPSDIEQYIQL